MRFDQPAILLLLLALPLLAGFAVVNARLLRRRTDRFIEAPLLERLVPSVSPTRRRARRILFFLALALLILAAARPQFGERVKFLQRKGMDLVYVLDTSLSMAATDLKPDRFAAARHFLARLTEKLSGDRVALVGFAGDAFIQSPLTADYGGLLLQLESLQVGALPLPGTNLEAAAGQALRAVAPDQGTDRQAAIIILSDGENHVGDLDAAIKEVKASGSVVYAIGVGTEAGVPLETRGGYKKDRAGNVVVTRLDPAPLERLAEATGGKYYALSTDEKEVDELRQELEKFERTSLLTKRVEGYAERYQWFLVAAFLLLAIEAGLSVRRT